MWLTIFFLLKFMIIYSQWPISNWSGNDQLTMRPKGSIVRVQNIWSPSGSFRFSLLVLTLLLLLSFQQSLPSEGDRRSSPFLFWIWSRCFSFTLFFILISRKQVVLVYCTTLVAMTTDLVLWMFQWVKMNASLSLVEERTRCDRTWVYCSHISLSLKGFGAWHWVPVIKK